MPLNIIVDKNNNQIDLRPRGDIYNKKLIHRSSHLILFNSKNEILLQKRADDKKLYPGLYTFSVSGGVENETFEECIHRETMEEIGLSCPKEFLFTFKSFNETDNAFRSVFLAISDEVITPDEREMSETIRIDANELKRKIDTTPEIFTEPLVEGMKLFYSIYYGVYLRRKNK